MTTLSPDDLDRLAIDTIRSLSIDAVQQADPADPTPLIAGAIR